MLISHPIFQSLLARAAAPISGKNTHMVPRLSPENPVASDAMFSREGRPSAAAISAISAISAANSAASSGSISSVDTGAGAGEVDDFVVVRAESAPLFRDNSNNLSKSYKMKSRRKDAVDVGEALSLEVVDTSNTKRT